MRSLVLVVVAVMLLLAAGVVVLRDERQQARKDRLGLDELRQIYFRHRPR